MKLLTLILCVAFGVFANAQDFGQKLSDVSSYMSTLKSASEKVTAIECDFVMYKKVSMMKDINKSAGRFSYCKQQHRMTLDYTEPKDNKVIVDGDTFTITMGGKTTTMTSNHNPAMSQLSAMITACMSGNFTSLCERSKTTYYIADNIFTMVIEPLNKRVQRYMTQIVLRFELTDNTMSVMRITEKNGDYTEYVFNNKQIK